MDFRTYQEQALTTDQIPSIEGTDKIVPLLGLAGEAGELLSEYKKHLRDGNAHKLFKERIAEELGDLLWYIANVASKFELDLEEIAKDNLKKCQERWSWRDTEQHSVKKSGYLFDCKFPENERLPRKFEVQITQENQNNSVRMKAFINGKQIGNYLTDNSYSNDGYRFHDIFHLSYAAILGWSPVIRSNLNCKRKSDLLVDEVEDGGRAIAIEEGISALVFSYAKDHSFLDGILTVDYQLLKTIKNITSHLEVARCSLGDWEQAILTGYEIWRQVKENQGGKVIVNLDERSLLLAGR
ncbi:MazG nucleotide pyrophosphohydrolase (plasmid) [Gloeothece citriformis PCC 7424]|uniref:MazG nucleotide pyrophosphohydrolase n=1 Tax=Gloeothece citriformis (strain PCC 7424) TaxID=65393 RepID=B7KMY3_GLOC7|nr:nucleoside triphosphate pyrophosphohydrolase family protein [Gloeothece citriformis]ACK74155.1 MazG nucleotide pyrophosphohydrolase [Gloeothece citriformis PCC 7424]